MAVYCRRHITCCVSAAARHCFELYGYDVLLDASLRPWLIEVNASPSLSTTTEPDRVMKSALLRDVFAVVAPQVPPSLPE